ncbi:glucose-1-phosphate adenylyltransferase [Thermotoga sp. KOL6]|uniref:glucose-1-phosphate adenylyltransferase n=1 Tax=Thermotoga sp. KOL6 TaxID=126741 RepID=UPI000C76BF6F|nr:glucose-1-phosphate adenylyltransferase [Thermotoga sp. KOL6]PLV58995.1 glucose-1-phosphate adenylyltransferase [Thermotoga sp. KOL6]
MGNVVAMILAGGQGTRLGVLTEKIAKPAVPFGGKYRLIDFTLSNCVNSGIYRVGVLTQYRPHVLAKHIGIGRPWDLDRKDGGVEILPPYVGRNESDWYKGTANAVYQNLEFLEENNAELVLVLSGDHVYAMNYNDLIDYHLSKGADGTIACMEVPLEEASRFGIMITDVEGRIVDFEEKPAKPRSNLASLGIYVFNYEFLKEVLIEDDTDSTSSHDFGKDVIPRILKENKGSLYAFRFDGYWRDVGTLRSYWETNLELLLPIPPFNLYDPNWKFFTHSEEMPPAYVSSEAKTITALISEGAEIYGEVSNSVIFQGVKIGKGTTVRNSVIMTKTEIGENCYLENVIIAENVKVGNNVKIGVGEDAGSKLNPKIYTGLLTVVGMNSEIPDNMVIGKNCVIGVGVSSTDFKTQHLESGDYVLAKGE